MADKVDVVIPTIGESVSEGTIGRWFFKEGDLVKKDQPLFEVDSDKATLEVPAAATGRLASILVPQGKTARVGSKVAIIESSAEAEAAGSQSSTGALGSSGRALEETPKPASALQQPAPRTTSELGKVDHAVATSAPAAAPDSYSDEDFRGVAPSKRRAIRSGSMPAPSKQAPTSGGAPWTDSSAEEIRKPMTTLRRKIAERLVQSQQTTATLTTFNEIDMSNVMNIRNKLKDSFASKHGVKLGFMSFFSKAVIHALQEFPDVNGHIEGGDIVYNQNVHLGIAVSTERGLVVPVIRSAQRLGYADLEKRINDLAERARAGKLQIPEMSGGTFTVTNGGVFGSLLSTPIINPPQSGILGMHKIEMRPMAIQRPDKTYAVEVRPMMYVALSYDHRLIDGATSVGFLVKVKEYLETVTDDKVV